MPERTDLPSVRTVIKIKNYTNHFLLKPVIWQSAKGMCSAALSLPLIQRLFTELYQIMQASASFCLADWTIGVLLPFSAARC